MSSDADHADEVDPAEGWEYAGRQMLEVEAERIEQRTRELTRDLRRLDDPGLGVPRGSASEIRTIISRLERLADAVEAVDPAVGDAANGGDIPEADHDADAEAVEANTATRTDEAGE